MQRVKKLKWWGYQMVKKFKDNFNRLDTITGCDRQADRQTPHDSKERAMQSVARVKIRAELYFGDIRHPHLNWHRLHYTKFNPRRWIYTARARPRREWLLRILIRLTSRIILRMSHAQWVFGFYKIFVFTLLNGNVCVFTLFVCL